MSDDASVNITALGGSIKHWISQLNTKGLIDSHHLFCFKLVAEQLDLGLFVNSDRLFNSHCQNYVSSMLGLYDYLETGFGSPEKALQLIVDLMSFCRMNDCLKLMEDHTDLLPLSESSTPFLELTSPKPSQQAQFARFFAGVYCSLDSDQEREQFRRKLNQLFNRRFTGTEEEFLTHIVHNRFKDKDKKLVKKAVENIDLNVASEESVKQVFGNICVEPNRSRKLRCRLLIHSCLAVILGTIFILGVLGIVLISLVPPDNTSTATVLSGSVVIIEGLDTMWYGEVALGIINDEINLLTVAAPVSCSNLVSHKLSVYGMSGTIPGSRGTNPLQNLEVHSYLVHGSSLTVGITITHLPSGARPILYQLNKYETYWMLQSSVQKLSADQYVASYPIIVNKNGTFNVTIIVNSTDFQFFLLYLPVADDDIKFQYEFWLEKRYYSPNDYKFTCNVTTSDNFCPFPLVYYPVSDRIQCQPVLIESQSSLFNNVSTTTTRNRFVLVISVPILIVMSLLVVCCILLFVSCAFSIKKYRSPMTNKNGPSYHKLTDRTRPDVCASPDSS